MHEIGDSEAHHIQPEDSVSQISVGKVSMVSKHSSSSSLSSIKSALEKKMLHNATRKAALIAEGSLLARKQNLAFQEMKLMQMKEEFKLQEELVKLEAEEKVMGEVYKSDGQIIPSIFNTDQQGSLSAKQLRSADAQSSSEQLVVSGFINQPIRSITEPSPMTSKDGAVRLDTLHNLPVVTERKKVSTFDRFCGKDDFLQECCYEKVKTEDSRRKAMSQESTKLVYSTGDDIARGTSSFPNPAAQNLYPSLFQQNPCKPSFSSDEMPLTEVKIHKSSEGKPSGPRTSALSNHQFASLQSPPVPTVASPWSQHDDRLMHQPLIDYKRTNTAESSKRSEKQPHSLFFRVW